MTVYQVDSFTRTAFAGNPAGVCIVKSYPGAELMQNIAAEMNLSETAFVVPDGPEGRFLLRWFTPSVEVDLCGHATLAAAHIVWETGTIPPERSAVFETLSGELTVSRGEGGLLQMDFPAEPATAADPPEGLVEALGAVPIYTGRNRMDVLVELEDEVAVRTLRPNLSLIERISARGIIVTARADMEADFVSRFFAPQSGVPEDPVTGSAHCCLGPYWAEKLGKTSLKGYQASRRGGFVRTEVLEDRVLLSGYAVTVLRAEMNVA